ncbi:MULTISPECIES: ATP-binding protein [unclassified Pseudomonas]|uniref:AlbA family DNA-binding domain-containing protein n=1 Tax=unclassified Pseudomonas TaxID=196821 RepID=UPI000A097E63|nr:MULTISPECIES: ATP-binding protein [unclassified Pseudomonas]SMF23829.1 Predicted transcriptional regulator containing an HTH domain and an uncharacterized domain shared with the mammalian protein Schlafen [Pseudomonas sp. LAIL14HWK12:I11]SMR74264.1 Predicted transcriptional regulator containing an HTH domain and an uncharacterized domain shared with the mammalian protein Schlafen [Pseudomonas sp. LAIL14HWK12:I10]SOD03579.1 Predicted transcriptional regulator containing an HTH domain and an un
MPHFTPFNKNLDELEALDLISLKQISEGWYIEYKSQLSKASDIAKSISALANTYGGWVFYGISEESKENSVAGAFPGIDICEIDSALQRIRQAVANLISPACHYDTCVIKGPCEELALEAGKCIICVAVPESIEAPHVHHRGAIYRRIGDGSEPLAETDRQMIEKMFQRSSERIEHLAHWISSDPELSNDEDEIPFIRIMIVPNIWGMPRKPYKATIKSVKSALNLTEGRASFIPFDTIYKSANTVIARQCGTEDPIRARLTWSVHQDLSSEILVPLRVYKGSPDVTEYHLRERQNIEAYCDRLRLTEAENFDIIDLSILYNVLHGVIESQRELQRQAGWPLDFEIKVKVINAWRTIPYLDTEFFIDLINENGIPVNLNEECVSPTGSHPETFWSVPDNSNNLESGIGAGIQTIIAFCPIAEAFGIPLPELLSEEGRLELIRTQLTEAGIQAALKQ